MKRGSLIVLILAIPAWVLAIDGGEAVVVTNLWDLSPSHLYLGDTTASNGLVITAGGRVENQNGYIGYSSGAIGNVAIVQSNGVWSSSGRLSVGFEGSGNRMVVSDGGYVASDSGRIGDEVDSTDNHVLVTGSDSAWWNNNQLRVGDNGSGNSLTISDGGMVYNTYGYIGFEVGAESNSLTVAGSGSVWDNRANISIGLRGAGSTLVITNGGHVYNGAGTLGYRETSFGNRVNISGSGSVWSNRFNLSVGREGAGNSMTVSDGGRVYNRTGSIGKFSTSHSNKVLVTGMDSLWSNSDNLYLGGYSDGTNWFAGGTGNSLTVEDGGRVLAGNVYTDTLAALGSDGGIVVGDTDGVDMLVANGSRVDTENTWIGLGTHDHGTLTVSGSNTVWNTSDRLYVGFEGSGNRLTLSDGAQLGSLSANIGRSSDNNEVLMTGANSLWNVHLLVVGGAGSENNLTIAAGGRVQAVAGVLGLDIDAETNSIRVTGNDSALMFSDYLLFGSGSANSMIVADGGRRTR